MSGALIKIKYNRQAIKGTFINKLFRIRKCLFNFESVIDQSNTVFL